VSEMGIFIDYNLRNGIRLGKMEKCKTLENIFGKTDTFSPTFTLRNDDNSQNEWNPRYAIICFSCHALRILAFASVCVFQAWNLLEGEG
jgi:hypothetical protein